MNPFLRRGLLLGLLFLFPARAHSFDVIDRQTGFIASKYLTLGTGVGFTGFARDKGIEGDAGFGLKVSAGHQFSPFLFGEIYYQFSTFQFSSPDPVANTQQISTGAQMNQEAFRLMALYPAVLAQPYVTVGFGGYNWMGVDRSTALRIPINMMVPVSVGVRAFLYQHLISLDTEFNYQFMFGENQDPQTLALLGLSEVSFDSYSVLTSVTFHFF